MVHAAPAVEPRCARSARVHQSTGPEPEPNHKPEPEPVPNPEPEPEPEPETESSLRGRSVSRSRRLARAMTDRRYDARTLLQELVRRWPELERLGWREPVEEGELRVRYRRIAALGAALELGSVSDLASGAFLEREPKRRGVVLDRLAATVYERARPSTGFEARVAFQWLLRHRVQAERLMRVDEGVLECSIGSLAAIMSEHARIATGLSAQLETSELWLAALIDPDARTFSETELARWGWPHDDPDELRLRALWEDVDG